MILLKYMPLNDFIGSHRNAVELMKNMRVEKMVLIRNHLLIHEDCNATEREKCLNKKG